ncbi:hypothetical protein ACCI51_15475 [Microbulbifer echini]|uniref:Uncharacterized protein n=1 Tax=Microbulbifer echini TaxID=1529067 RepID=A0ABV4NQZ5_9GAMM
MKSFSGLLCIEYLFFSSTHQKLAGSASHLKNHWCKKLARNWKKSAQGKAVVKRKIPHNV